MELVVLEVWVEFCRCQLIILEHELSVFYYEFLDFFYYCCYGDVSVMFVMIS